MGVLAVTAFVAANMGGESPADPDASASSTSPHGGNALYTLVSKSGYATQIVREDWPKLSQSPASAVFVINPDETDIFDEPTDPSENVALAARSVRAWVASGHTLIWLSSTEEHGTYDSDLQHKLMFTPSELSGPTIVGPNSVSNEVRYIHGIAADSSLAKLPVGFVPLCSIADKVVAAKCTLGKGTIYVVGDGEMADNKNLRYSDNALLLMTLLRYSQSPGASVWFFEPRHLFDKNAGIGATPWSVLGSTIHWSVYQSIIAAFLAIVALGSRFGTARLSALNSTRTSAEYISSMASIFQMADASQSSLQMIYRKFVKDASKKVGCEPDSSLELLSRRIAIQADLPKEDVAQLLIDCESAVDSKSRLEHEAVDLVQRLLLMRKELGID